MSARLVGFRNKFSNFAQSNTQKIINSVESVHFPTRLKGTIVEKWFNYWRQLALDYKDVALDVGQQIRNKPLKASVIGSMLFGVYLAEKRNPDETSFIDLLRSYNSDMMVVHESCQNPETSKHLKFIERCVNEGTIRRLSLGVVSFIWIDNYDRNLAIYKALCPYLEPRYLTFNERIVDIGFWNKWWILDKIMVDYDVNV